MGLFDAQSRLSLVVTSGKQYLNMGAFSVAISMSKGRDGSVLFGSLPYRYEILEYRWDGARYQTVSSTVSSQKGNSTSRGKEKEVRTGRVAGAVIGTVLFPVVGTVIGASLGTGKRTDSKGSGAFHNKGTETTATKDTEVKTNATMRLRNLDTGEVFVIGFQCDTRTDAEMQNFYFSRGREVFSANVSQQKNNVELLKEYKELLDMGIITSEEFFRKKRELIG